MEIDLLAELKETRERLEAMTIKYHNLRELLEHIEMDASKYLKQNR